MLYVAPRRLGVNFRQEGRATGLRTDVPLNGQFSGPLTGD